MNKPRLPQELSLEELLKAASTEEPVKTSTSPKAQSRDPILHFLQAFDLKPGTNEVSWSILFQLYNAWKVGPSMPIASFKKRMSSYLGSYKNNGRLAYYLNKDLNYLAGDLQAERDGRSHYRTKSRLWLNHIQKFFNSTQLTAGSVYVEADVLFYIYNRWCDQTRKKQRLSLRDFSTICTMDFDSKILANSSQVWFGLSANVKELITKEEVRNWRAGRKKYVKEEKGLEKTKDFKEARKEILYAQKAYKKKSD
jgi:hypothetical protein